MKSRLILVFLGLSLVFTSISSAGQNSKKITEADIKKCVAKKKKEALARGYPLQDPFAVRFECIKELKGE